MYINPKIKVIGKNIKESFYCKICSYPLLSSEDFDKSETYECCHECYMQFVESRRESWKNGWRPTKTDVVSYISIRRKLYNNAKKEKKYVT